MKKGMKGITAMICAAMLLSTTAVTAFADGDSFTLEKISHPENGEREADGLIPETDRETSYAWCMAARGKYVYIGTNKNITGDIINSFAASGLNQELLWSLSNVITNGEIPRPQTDCGGYILRCDTETNEITVLYKANYGVSFRMAIEHNGNVYFGSYSTSDGLSDSSDIIGYKNSIIKIDENDEISVVYSADNATSMRAACVHEDELYFGGVDSTQTLDAGDEDCVKLAIICKDENDDSNWYRVADYKDFRQYANNPALKAGASSPIWDICSYKGDIYAVLPNGKGFIMYKGHKAAENEENANQYGWVWEEVIGMTNGINYPGLGENPTGNVLPEQGCVALTATPFVFKDKLYVMTFDHTIGSISKAISGIVSIASNQDFSISDSLRTMYTTLQNPQKIYCLNDETGAFEECEEFTQLMEGTCNEYVWRYAVYNDELYITTMDSATIYNYVTRLTNGSLATMSKDEIIEQLDYILVLLNQIKDLVKNSVNAEDIMQKIAQTEQQIKEFKQIVIEYFKMEFTPENVKIFMQQYLEIIDSVKNIVETEGLDGLYSILLSMANVTGQNVKEKVDQIKESLGEAYNSIDWEGLEMYAYISDAVKNNAWGFDMYKTSDMKNFELITNDGFGDKYNYGGRSLVATDSGLYIGTANPFYGAQLWRLTEKAVTDEENPPEEDNNNNPEVNPSPDDNENVVPPTGDKSSIALILAAMTTSVGIAGLTLKSRKKKEIQ